MTIFERIKRVLVEEMGLETDDVLPSASFVQMGLDSLEMASLVLELEDEFKIEITDDDLKHIFTPQDVVKYVDSHCVRA